MQPLLIQFTKNLHELAKINCPASFNPCVTVLKITESVFLRIYKQLKVIINYISDSTTWNIFAMENFCHPTLQYQSIDLFHLIPQSNLQSFGTQIVDLIKSYFLLHMRDDLENLQGVQINFNSDIHSGKISIKHTTQRCVLKFSSHPT